MKRIDTITSNDIITQRVEVPTTEDHTIVFNTKEELFAAMKKIEEDGEWECLGDVCVFHYHNDME